MKPLIGINCEFRPEEGHQLFSPPAYTKAVSLAGGLPVLLPILKDEKDVKGLLSRLDGLVLTGGRDLDPSIYGPLRDARMEGEKKHPASLVEPERAHFDIMLAKGAIEQGLPILAICYGAQLINVALGGTLIQHIPDEISAHLAHQKKRGDAFHSVKLKPQSRLAEIIGRVEIEVNSNHHQAVRRLGKGLKISAKAPDGVIEGLEGEGKNFCIAVQWHPERLTCRPEHLALFKALVQTAAVRPDRKAGSGFILKVHPEGTTQPYEKPDSQTA